MRRIIASAALVMAFALLAAPSASAQVGGYGGPPFGGPGGFGFGMAGGPGGFGPGMPGAASRAVARPS